ncbi:MAG: nucleotidyltransferase domain-containing protein [Rhodospirillales bacterium]
MATTSTERQRRRRARLKADGFVDVTVTVPREQAAAVRRFARNLAAGDGGTMPNRLSVVLRVLRDNREKLEALGVIHAGVFGSTARGDYRPDSDVDVLMETDGKVSRGMLDLVRAASAIKQEVQTAFPDIGVDVAEIGSLKPNVRSSVEAEVVYGF